MKHKDGLTARCPMFQARGSWRGQYWIDCIACGRVYLSKARRDEMYEKDCCGSRCAILSGRERHDDNAGRRSER